MLWNYLQQITFHLHSSITKYIVKTFVIFLPPTYYKLGVRPVTQSFSVLAPFSLGCKVLKILPHTFKTKDSVCFFPFLFFFFLCNINFVQRDKCGYEQKLGALMEVKGPMWTRGVCVCVCHRATKASMPFCQIEKRPSVLKGSVPLRTNCRQLHLARVHNNCDHSDSRDMLLCASFLWQSPKTVMQATKIDFEDKR